MESDRTCFPTSCDPVKLFYFWPPQHLLLWGTARKKSRKPKPVPEAFEDHVQIHQVGDDIGLAVIQGLQGLRKEKERSAQTCRHQTESKPSVTTIAEAQHRPRRADGPLCATECRDISGPWPLPLQRQRVRGGERNGAPTSYAVISHARVF